MLINFIVDVIVGDLNEIFYKANHLFKFITFYKMSRWYSRIYWFRTMCSITAFFNPLI